MKIAKINIEKNPIIMKEFMKILKAESNKKDIFYRKKDSNDLIFYDISQEELDKAFLKYNHDLALKRGMPYDNPFDLNKIRDKTVKKWLNFILDRIEER